MNEISAPTVIDLFSGAGGMSLGFRAAGCRLLAAFDRDPQARATYRQNFRVLQPGYLPDVPDGESANLVDVDKSSFRDREPPTILVASPPCQGFSRVGRAKLNSLNEHGFARDARNELSYRVVELARLWRPRAVIIENVPSMRSVGGRNVALDVTNALIDAEYSVGYGVLNAACFGVPQYRDRLFIVAFRRDLGRWPQFPAATHRVKLPVGYERLRDGTDPMFRGHPLQLSVHLGKEARDAVTVGDAFEDLPVLREHLDGKMRAIETETVRPYRYTPGSSYAKLMRDWPGFPSSTQVTDCWFRSNSRDYETFSRMRPGDRYTDAHKIAVDRYEEARRAAGQEAPYLGSPKDDALRRKFVPPYPVDKFRCKWRKLSADQLSWTVTAHLGKDGYSHIHPDSDQGRTITVREAARLQSFPDAFQFSGNRGDCFRQVGNAVPPRLAWALATSVLQQLGYPVVSPTPVSDEARDLDAIRASLRTG